MAKQIISSGSAANDRTGDNLRNSAGKINANFNELYSALGNGSVLSVAAVAKTGSYNDLTNKPSLFSGSYGDLTNKPTIPSDISQLTDNTGLLGQGGNANTGDVTFSTNSIIGNNGNLFLKAEPNAGWNDDYGVRLFYSIDNDTHLSPLTRDKGIALGFAYGTGSHVRVEGYNGQGGVPGTGDRVGIFVMNNDTGANNEWLFNSGGLLQLGALGAIRADSETGTITIADWLGPNGEPAMPSTAIHIGGTNVFAISRGNGNNNPSWLFKDDGSLTLPIGGDIKDVYGNTVLNSGASNSYNLVSNPSTTSNVVTIDFSKSVTRVVLDASTTTLAYSNLPTTMKTASTVVVLVQDYAGNRTITGDYKTQSGAGLDIDYTPNSVSIVSFVATNDGQNNVVYAFSNGTNFS